MVDIVACCLLGSCRLLVARWLLADHDHGIICMLTFGGVCENSSEVSIASQIPCKEKDYWHKAGGGWGFIVQSSMVHKKEKGEARMPWFVAWWWWWIMMRDAHVMEYACAVCPVAFKCSVRACTNIIQEGIYGREQGEGASCM